MPPHYLLCGGICPHCPPYSSAYDRAPFSRAINFVNGLISEVQGNCFHESTLVSSLQSAIHVTIEFPLIFGEKNFVEVPKIHEIHKIFNPRKRRPMVHSNAYLYQQFSIIENKVCLTVSRLVNFVSALTSLLDKQW